MRDLIAGEVLNILRSDETDARVETSLGRLPRRRETSQMRKAAVEWCTLEEGREFERVREDWTASSSVTGLNLRVTISDEEDASGWQPLARRTLGIDVKLQVLGTSRDIVEIPRDLDLQGYVKLRGWGENHQDKDWRSVRIIAKFVTEKISIKMRKL